MSIDDDTFDDRAYALVWYMPGGRPLYWSLTKGWTSNSTYAWLLNKWEVDDIENDDRLLSKLPQRNERKDGANWEPISTFEEQSLQL